jgi:4-oxalocrotonate tautomerase family enzyme
LRIVKIGDDKMPLIRIEMIKGKSSEYKKTLLDSVHEGLEESIGIPDWDRFQRIIEIDREDFETSPEKTDDFMIIEITMFPGRTKEQKKTLIETVTKKLTSSLSIRPEDVFIVINEPSDENWGMAGKQRQV